MLHRLRRHPLPIEAHFEWSLVLAYALPAAALEPLLPPGLVLDRYEDFGILAIALVQTRALRPRGLPRWMGRDFFLSGYRVFARYTTPEGRTLRGLRILRSDTNRRVMAWFGNLLTHYAYQVARVRTARNGSRLEIEVHTPRGDADLHVVADLASRPAALPSSSPFPDLRVARLFAGPLPFTFDYEPETHGIVRIEGVRSHWDPQPVQVDVQRVEFLRRPELAAARLANAFYLEDVPYHWRRGIWSPLSR